MVIAKLEVPMVKVCSSWAGLEYQVSNLTSLAGQGSHLLERTETCFFGLERQILPMFSEERIQSKRLVKNTVMFAQRHMLDF